MKHDEKVLNAAAETDDNGYAVCVAASCNGSQWPTCSIYNADLARCERA